MAVCSLDKFTITRGVDNEFYFTVKANGSLLPLEIDASDSFVLKLVRLSDNTTVDLVKTLSHRDRQNGKVTLFISKEESISLISKRGPEEHGYYLRPTYKMLLEASTVNNGQFVAKLGKVYVG